MWTARKESRCMRFWCWCKHVQCLFVYSNSLQASLFSITKVQVDLLSLDFCDMRLKKKRNEVWVCGLYHPAGGAGALSGHMMAGPTVLTGATLFTEWAVFTWRTGLLTAAHNTKWTKKKKQYILATSGLTNDRKTNKLCHLQKLNRPLSQRRYIHMKSQPLCLFWRSQYLKSILSPAVKS